MSALVSSAARVFKEGAAIARPIGNVGIQNRPRRETLVGVQYWSHPFGRVPSGCHP